MEEEIRGRPIAYWMERFAQAEVDEIVGMAYHYQAVEAQRKAARALYDYERAARRRLGQLRKPVRSVGVAELPLTFTQDQRVRRMMRLAERIGA